MCFKQSKILKIYLIVLIIEILAFTVLATLGNIERTGYIHISDLSHKILSEEKIVYFYNIRINYYSKTFRNSDIYSVYPKNDNLPEYIKSIEWIEKGNPFGKLESTTLLPDEKIDIQYTLKVKNMLLWGILLFLALSIGIYIYILKNNKNEKLAVMHKKILKHEVLLPILLLFSFLFYVLWSAPVSVLAKEFQINNYYIFDNYMIIISFLTTVILAIILVAPYKKNETIINKKFRATVIGIIYFIAISSILYNYIFPYKYGFLQEGITLETSENLLDFSSYYYILDIAIITFSILLSIIIIKKNIKVIPLILLVFYAFTNVATLFSLKVSDKELQNLSPIDSGIKISLNKQNVVLFIFDTTGPFDMLNAIEDLPKEYTEWTKDFMFYDNVVALTIGSTAPSLPSMVGGFDYNPQIHIKEIIDNNLTYKSERVKKMKYVSGDKLIFFYSEALEKIDDILDDNIYISANSIDENSISYNEKYMATEELLVSPISALSYYSIMPYFMRYLVVDENNNKKWNSKFLNSYKWTYRLSDAKKYLVKFDNTDTPTFNTMLTWGLHPPYTLYPIDDISEKEMKTAKGLERARNQALSFQFIMVSDFIDKLKEYGIYDNTRILISSDNGDRSDKTGILIENHTGNFIAKEGYNSHKGITSFIMNKDFNSKTNIFAIDSRHLATPDIHSMIINSLTNKDGYFDYTKTMPPKRVFNIPDISWTVYHAYIFDNTANSYAQKDKETLLINIKENNGKIQYLKINSLLPPDYEYLYYPFETIDELPAYEIVE